LIYCARSAGIDSHLAHDSSTETMRTRDDRRP
jgi:hypothetical protein